VPVWSEDVNAVAGRKLRERGDVGVPGWADRAEPKSWGRGWTVIFKTDHGEVSVDVSRAEAEAFVREKWAKHDKAKGEEAGRAGKTE
jgi:hypothetical protein